MMNWKWQIHLLFFSQVIIIASLNMSDPYWPLIIQAWHENINPTELQYFSAAIYIIPFLLTIITIPLWGWLGDKIGHKKMLLRASIALTLTQLLLSFVHDPYFILLIRMIQGVFAGFTAAAQIWSVTMSAVEKQNYVIGRMQAGTAIGTVIGPLFGGIVAYYCNYTTIFYLSSTLCAVVVVALYKGLNETPIKIASCHPILAHKKVFLEKSIIYVLILICFSQAAKWMSTPFLALYVVQQLNGTTLSTGALYSCIALAIFLSAPHWGMLIDKQRHAPQAIKYIFISSLCFAALAQLIFAFTENIILALAAALMWGMCQALISLVPFTLLIRLAGSEGKGSVIGLGNSASKLGNLTGVAAGALIQSQTNFTMSFIMIALIYGVIGLAQFAFSWNDERQGELVAKNV